jgi:DNA repair protein RadC
LFTNSADVAGWASARLSNLDHEELWLLALDGRSRLRAVRCVAKGGLHGAAVRAADPLRVALRAAAAGFVLVHNHPSGDPTPSPEDVRFTRRVASAAAVVEMPLLDHVVVARGGFASVPFAVEPLPPTGGPVG